ncbi:MAG: type II toxin-antitoxin system HicB family antitoxin [Deferribacterales bacterium]
MKLAYPCRIKPKNDTYLISFRDFKELCAESRSYEEALETAEEVLNNLLEIILEEDEMPRSPSLPKADEVLIPVRPGISGRIS